jgi:HK97 family phage prohead protease
MNSMQPQTSPPSSTDLSTRLTPLSDGRPGIRAALAVQASSPEPGGNDVAQRPVIDFVASNEALDRFDEIIMPAGWRLEKYRRNPVFQNAHQYGDVMFTLGKALLTEVREVSGRPVLFQRIEFAVEINPMARIAYGLYRGKFLNAVSVGFIPIRWENGSEEAGYRRRYVEQELLEVSAVGIPANPEALQLGLKAGAVEKADLKALLDLLHRFSDAGESSLKEPASTLFPSNGFCSNPAAADTHSSARGVPGNGAQWLQLARALRELLRRI